MPNKSSQNRSIWSQLVYYFCHFKTVDKICRWLDSNGEPMMSEAAALPTEPQPLPICLLVCISVTAGKFVQSKGLKTIQSGGHFSKSLRSLETEVWSENFASGWVGKTNFIPVRLKPVETNSNWLKRIITGQSKVYKKV